MLLNIIFVFLFSLQRLKHFSFQEELSEIWSEMFIDPLWKYPLFLFDFNES